MTLTNASLLPCPFCGTMPEIVHLAHPSGLPGIKCPSCGYIMKADRTDKLIGTWNNRTINWVYLDGKAENLPPPGRYWIVTSTEVYNPIEIKFPLDGFSIEYNRDWWLEFVKCYTPSPTPHPPTPKVTGHE